MRLCIITYSSAPNPALGMFCFSWDSLSLSHSLTLSLSLCQMTHTLESESGFRWFVQSFVRSFALLLLRAEHLRKGGEVQSKVESWVHPVI